MILYNTTQMYIYTRTSQTKYVNSKEMRFMVGVNLELSMSDLPSHSGISINIIKYVSTLKRQVYAPGISITGVNCCVQP